MTFVIKKVRDVEPERRRVPRVLHTFGSPEPDGFRVYLSRQAEEKILAAMPRETPVVENLSSLARAFLGENECGGILIGNVYEAEGRTYTAIVDAIAAEDASAGPTHVEMGVDDLLAVANYIEKLKSGSERPCELRVVGWYHTHPGFGVFMSGTDRATQQQVFGMPWQIAVVYDPINGEYGMFHGPNSIGAPGWYIFDALAEGFPPPLNPSMAARRGGRARTAEIPDLHIVRSQLLGDLDRLLDGWRELLFLEFPRD